MGITRCAAECFIISRADACGTLWGCSWANGTLVTATTADGTGDVMMVMVGGGCTAASTGADGKLGNLWLGVILSVLGGIVIK